MLHNHHPSRIHAGSRFVVLGDDVYLNGAHMASLLSAFNPANSWCITHAGRTVKHGFRIYGGAGIATSAGLTKTLAETLPQHYQDQLRNHARKGASGADASKVRLKYDLFACVHFATTRLLQLLPGNDAKRVIAPAGT